MTGRRADFHGHAPDASVFSSLAERCGIGECFDFRHHQGKRRKRSVDHIPGLRYLCHRLLNVEN
jgi:hypothetical protein